MRPQPVYAAAVQGRHLRRFSLACLAACLGSVACDSSLEPAAQTSKVAAAPAQRGDAAAPEGERAPAPEALPEPEPEPEPEPKAPYELQEFDHEVALHAIDDPSGHALDHFYAALTSIDPGPGLVRVLHLGDSSIGRDGFPDQMRARFWRRFGDGGPGFLMPEAFTGFYAPKSAVLDSNEKWKHCYIAYGCRPDGHYGLGGVVFSSTGGARTHFRTTSPRSKRPWGRSWAHAELWYAAVPRGGQLSVQIDDAEPVRVEAKNEDWEDRWWSQDLEPGAHQFSLRSRGYGRSRVYGVVLESAGPGIVWDAIPMSGAFTKRLLFWDPQHLAAQVARRDPDLIVLQYGGNDLKRIVTGTSATTFREELDQVLPRVRAGVPESSCLVVGISAHGRSGHFDVKEKHVETLVGVQRDAAFAHGCAFFDSYQAMGGKGSLRKWRKRGLVWGDLAHLSPKGHGEMAGILYSALSAGYVAFRRRDPDDPALPEPVVPQPAPPN